MRVTLLAPRRHSETTTQAAQTTAVLVCHGMGQQVPFETISAIARSILAEAGVDNAPAVGRVQVGDQITARAEIKFADGQRAHEVHVYEAYWAPLTEGKITLRSVLLFLFSAGARGIPAALRGQFLRWKFGGLQPCTIKRATFFSLLAALLLLVSLVLLYGALIASVPKQFAFLVTASLQIGDQSSFLRAITYSPFSLWPLPIVVLPFLKLLPHPLGGRSPSWLAALAMIVVIGLALLTIFGGVLAGHAFWIAVFGGSAWKWVDALPMFGAPWVLSLWLGAAALFAAIRYFLVEFVGDVAIYVSSYKVSQFDETRKAIQKTGRDMATVICKAGAAGDGVKYDRILFVGHSLGSVVAYDTLNDMLVRGVFDPTLDVAGRTAALVTFGSPLDKTAFLFRTQVQAPDGQPDDIREALAASVQPLIEGAAMRPHPNCGFEWTNIFAPADIISGSLEYYNDANSPPSVPDVDNHVDPDANLPLAAHVQYWGNRTLAAVLHRHITR